MGNPCGGGNDRFYRGAWFYDTAGKKCRQAGYRNSRYVRDWPDWGVADQPAEYSGEESAAVEEFKMSKVRKIDFYYILSILSVILLLAVWWLASAANDSLAGPGQTVERFFRLIENPIMGKPVSVHILASMRRILVAFFAASVVGIGLGVCFGIQPFGVCSGRFFLF